MITEEEKEFESLAEPVTLGTFVLVGDEFEMMLVAELVVFEMELVFFEGGTLGPELCDLPDLIPDEDNLFVSLRLLIPFVDLLLGDL